MRRGATTILCIYLSICLSIYLFLTQHLLYPEATKLFFSPIPPTSLLLPPRPHISLSLKSLVLLPGMRSLLLSKLIYNPFFSKIVNRFLKQNLTNSYSGGEDSFIVTVLFIPELLPSSTQNSHAGLKFLVKAHFSLKK